MSSLANPFAPEELEKWYRAKQQDDIPLRRIGGSTDGVMQTVRKVSPLEGTSPLISFFFFFFFFELSSPRTSIQMYDCRTKQTNFHGIWTVLKLRLGRLWQLVLLEALLLECTMDCR